MRVISELEKWAGGWRWWWRGWIWVWLCSCLIYATSARSVVAVVAAAAAKWIEVDLNVWKEAFISLLSSHSLSNSTFVLLVMQVRLLVDAWLLKAWWNEILWCAYYSQRSYEIGCFKELGLTQPFFREICASEYTMQLPAILCIIIIRFKRLENCEVEFGVAVLTCKSCLAASAPALVLKVTKPTGCKERNSHELSLLDLIFSTIVKGPVCVMSKSCKRTLLHG